MNPAELQRPKRPPEALLALWADQFDEALELPSLSAELPFTLWVAKQAATHNPAILVDLTEGTTDHAAQEQRYNAVTGVQVEHYGVPEIVDARSPEAQFPYVAWSVEGGQTLRAMLDARKPPGRRKALELARALAETLAELHRFGHTVNGLNPASVWIGPAGLTQILGLGLSRFDASDLYGEGLRYRAPEQLRREPGSMSERVLASAQRERADVWALGMIVLELLDKRPRLRCQDPVELLTEIEEANLVPTSQTVAWELKTLVSQMLTTDLEQRTLTAEDVAAELDGILMSTAERGVARDMPATAVITAPSASATQPEDWTWRTAARELGARRQAFDATPDAPAWKLWLLPLLALGAMGVVLYVLMQNLSF